MSPESVVVQTVEREVLQSLTRSAAPLMPSDEVESTVARAEANLRGLGPLQPLLELPDVSDILVNGTGDVWIERDGRLESTPLVLDPSTVYRILERIVGPLGLHVDRAQPVVDARLPDGSRVHGIVPPLAVDGPCLTIRRFTARRIALEQVCSRGVAALLRHAIRSRSNILVCGGAGAGKTTMLNALASEIAAGERIVTVEDAAELNLARRHVVRLEARPANAEGVGEVRIRELVRNALRMRPDRIVVGEVRGPEAIDMLQAMNTGHDGSLSTCHANTPGDALRRIETLVLMGEVALPLRAVRDQIAAALDLVVHMERDATGARAVTGVEEVGTEVDGEAAVPTIGLCIDGRLRRLPTRPPRRGTEKPDRGWLE
jgi:pilus assembly protein CpaF